MTIPAAGSHAGPVVQTARIDAIDVLRGFALLGILLMNVQSFAMPQAAYFNPTAYGDLEGANLNVWVAVRMLADQKFMTIFSMLFGAGIVLMAGGRRRAATPAGCTTAAWDGCWSSGCCTRTCSGRATSCSSTRSAACWSTRCATSRRGG